MPCVLPSGTICLGGLLANLTKTVEGRLSLRLLTRDARLLLAVGLVDVRLWHGRPEGEGVREARRPGMAARGDATYSQAQPTRRRRTVVILRRGRGR